MRMIELDETAAGRCAVAEGGDGGPDIGTTRLRFVPYADFSGASTPREKRHAESVPVSHEFNRISAFAQKRLSRPQQLPRRGEDLAETS
jgi:hypothetical protein